MLQVHHHPQTALLRLHELALQNRLVEKFDPTADPAGGFVVKLTLGNESYSGRGNTIKAAKQNAAMQALVTTKYKAMSTMKARPDGVTATSQGCILNHVVILRSFCYEYTMISLQRC